MRVAAIVEECVTASELRSGIQRMHEVLASSLSDKQGVAWSTALVCLQALDLLVEDPLAPRLRHAACRHVLASGCFETLFGVASTSHVYAVVLCCSGLAA